MTARRLMPPCTVLFLLLTVVGGGWCQTQLLDPEPRTCRTQDNPADTSTLSQGRRNEYPAGGVLMILANVPAGLFGSLEVYLCPDGNIKVECLDRVLLQLADGSGTSYSLQKVPRTDKYEIPVILPDDIICPTCTLQLRVLTRDCADEDSCPQEEDTFCSDITVREIKSPARRGFKLRTLSTVLGCAKMVVDTIDGREGGANEVAENVLSDYLIALSGRIAEKVSPENMEKMEKKLSEIQKKITGKVCMMTGNMKEKAKSFRNSVKRIPSKIKGKIGKSKKLY